jgi:hypothetical protein
MILASRQKPLLHVMYASTSKTDPERFVIILSSIEVAMYIGKSSIAIGPKPLETNSLCRSSIVWKSQMSESGGPFNVTLPSAKEPRSRASDLIPNLPLEQRLIEASRLFPNPSFDRCA